MLKRPIIISGGQTGVDRGALDAALAMSWPCGGTCPKGRLDENGVIPLLYPLNEAPSVQWDVRTRMNVDASDATIILVIDSSLSGGTLLTAEYARAQSKPLRILSEPWSVADAVAWIRKHDPEVLNVAGPRESGAPGIGRAAESFIKEVLGAL